MIAILKNIWRSMFLYIKSKQSLFSKESEDITNKYVSEQWRQIKETDNNVGRYTELDKTEYIENKIRLQLLHEQYQVKKQKWQDNVKQKYSQTKNCIDIVSYAKILEYLKYAGLEKLILESRYNDNTCMMTFVLSDSAANSICYHTTIRTYKTHYYSNTLNKLSESICMKWNNLECETDNVIE